MKIEKNLNCSTQTFFDKLTNSVLHDVYQATGEKLTADSLKGTSYFKKYTENTGASVTITEFIPNQMYAYETLTSRNHFIAKYQLEELPSNQCRVIYEEKMTSVDFMQKLNDGIFGLVLIPLKKRRFKKMLQAME